MNLFVLDTDILTLFQRGNSTILARVGITPLQKLRFPS